MAQNIADKYKFPERPTYEEIQGLGIIREEREEEMKLLQKAKENPFVPLGIALGLGALGYSIYNFKKSKVKLSLYLIHTRVAAQGAVVGALTIGALYKMISDYRNPSKT